MKKLVDVAIPVAIDREFTYLVPPELEQAAVMGVRVIVPFGRQFCTGVIVGHPAASSFAALKPVRDVIDARPLFTEEMLSLCRWISTYYFAPLGEVLKAALPHGFAATSSRLVRPTDRVTPALLDELRKSAPKRARLLSLLLDESRATSADLQKRVGVKTINVMLNELAEAGLVETEEMLPRSRTQAKLVEMVKLHDVDGSALDDALEQLAPRKKRARQFLEAVRAALEQGMGEIALADLLKRADVPADVAKPYCRDGLLPTTTREMTRGQEYGTEEQTLTIMLNETQQSILGRITRALDDSKSKTFLLHGVTGSGKTQVYIEAIRHACALGKTAIVLVPEISLTPQIVRRFKSHFGDQVAVVHSRMSPGERHDVWRLALRGTCKVVIGPRSAVFAPLSSIGLIVVDEEHESSYKQYDATPRYNARDVAIMRANACQAVVVLGSATPCAESYQNAAAGKYELLEMPMRVKEVTMPEITIVDMVAERKRAYAAMKATLPEDQRTRLKDFRQPTVSALLQEKIQDRLAKKEGIILLQNRRGFAPFVECPDCGYAEMCSNCNVTLTYHMTRKHLRCHYCGLVRALHSVCPTCGGTDLQMHGAGTQRVEEELRRLFPDARIIRMDLDTTTRKGAHDRILRKFGDREADILLGTQMVAKGLDFPHVTLVGVISADTQMLLPDFRASERTFQLLTQVAGRAGRSALKGEVLIQTYQPGHYMLQHVVDHDFQAYFGQEIAGRKELDYPPFSRLVLVETKGEDEEKVRRLAERFGSALKQTDGAFTVLGPAPAVIGRINRQYRWHIIVKSRKDQDPGGTHLRQAIRSALASLEKLRDPETRLIVDVDPVGVM